MAVRRFSDNGLTLRQVLQNTYAYKKNRFEYKKRDVIKRVKIEEITALSRDRLDIPIRKYRITSYSYPQYQPYLKLKGKKAQRQRTVRHEYDVVLELEELNLDSRFFWRVGSQKVWPDPKKIPQSKIKRIRKETMEKWKKKYPDKKRLDQIIKRHKKGARYIDEGDYISRVLGLNGDFHWRIENNLAQKGMLFGINRTTEESEEKHIFFDKHTLNVLMWLLRNRKIGY